MANQKNSHEMQTLSQDNLQLLSEEQLQDITGRGGLISKPAQTAVVHRAELLSPHDGKTVIASTVTKTSSPTITWPEVEAARKESMKNFTEMGQEVIKKLGRAGSGCWAPCCAGKR